MRTRRRLESGRDGSAASSADAGRQCWVARRTASAKLGREPEVHVLARQLDLFPVLIAERRKAIRDARDETVRRRGPGGETDDVVPLEPGGFEVALVVDEVGVGTALPGDLHEAIRVRACLRADDEDDRRLRADLLDGVLPVLRRVADVG